MRSAASSICPKASPICSSSSRLEQPLPWFMRTVLTADPRIRESFVENGPTRRAVTRIIPPRLLKAGQGLGVLDPSPKSRGGDRRFLRGHRASRCRFARRYAAAVFSSSVSSGGESIPALGRGGDPGLV